MLYEVITVEAGEAHVDFLPAQPVDGPEVDLAQARQRFRLKPAFRA